VTVALLVGWSGSLLVAQALWRPARAGLCQPLATDARNFGPPGPSEPSTASPLFAFNPPADPRVATADMGGQSSVELRLTLPVKGSPAAVSNAAESPAPGSTPPTDPAESQDRIPDDLRLLVVKDALRRSEHGAQIPPDAYTAVVQRFGSHAVQVAFCMERDPTLPGSSRHHVRPGAYTGTILLEGADGTVAATIPVTVRVQYQHLLWLAVLYLPVTVIAGGAFVYASGRGSGEAKALLSGEGIVDVFLWLRNNMIHVVAGMIAAMLSFIATAVSNPTFGSDSPKQFFTLLGVTFAGYTTTLAAGSASFKGNPTRSETATAATAGAVEGPGVPAAPPPPDQR